MAAASPRGALGISSIYKLEAARAMAEPVRIPQPIAAPPPQTASASLMEMLRVQEASHGPEAATATGISVLATTSPLELAMKGVAITSLFRSQA